MWEAIKKRFGKQNNFTHIFQIKQDIVQIKQNQRPITLFFGEMKKKWDELDIHQPEVIEAEKIRERKEQDRTFQFLANLDPSFEQVRQQILLKTSLPPLEEIVSLLEQEESRRSAMNSDTQSSDKPENQAFLSSNQNHNRKPNNPRGEMRGARNMARCDHCKKEGHDRDQCWFLNPHLRPKWWKGDKGGEARTCDDDKGERGRDRDRSHEERRGLLCANGSASYVGSGSDLGVASGSEAGQPNSLLSQQQLDQVLAQIKSSLGQRGKFTGMVSKQCLNSYTNNNWIVDSGATDHMTGNINLLTNIQPTKNTQNVIVANGAKIPIENTSNTNLFSKNIPNILHLPTFNSNLISVSKITKDLNCDVIFSSEAVIFQDKTTRMTIGKGHLENGLYILNFPNKAFVANIIEQNELWHWRIGHPSDKVLNKLFSFSNLDSSYCDICRLSKQTRLPFSLSNSKTSKIFELIHSDVWGPAPVESYNGFRYFVIFIDDFSRTTWIYLLK
jgi:GAG-pre-integrase domain